MFKVNNKDTGATPLVSFWCLYCQLWTYLTPCSSVSIVDFELEISLSYIWICTTRSSHWRCSVRKCVLINFAKFTRKHLCQSLFFNKVAGWGLQPIKKETLAQVFSCEFCEISYNTLFTEHLWATASVQPKLVKSSQQIMFSYKTIVYLQLTWKSKNHDIFWRKD